MIDSSAAALQVRALRGALALLGRSLFVRLVAILGGVLLARVLSPREFGLYAVVAFIVAFLTNFSDVGLGAALIQQPAVPSRRELETTFTLQLLLVTCLVVVGFLLASPISAAYHLSAGGVWLIRVLLLSLPIGLLRSIPAVLLERDLRYSRLSVIESVEALSFQLVAVGLALARFGVWSFVWAALVRAIAGVLTAYFVAPWRPGISFSPAVAGRLLRFGVPYQAQGVLSFTKDAMTPTFVGLLVGAAAVGYVNWAFGLAALPLAVTESVWRVTFPAFARAQQNRELLCSLIERTVRLSAILFLPLSILLLPAAPDLVHYIYTDKWAPALPAFYLFSISLWTGPLLGSTVFSAFYATGRARFALYFTVLYGVLDWGIGIPLVLLFGFTGIAVRAVIVAYGTLPLLLIALQRIVPVRVLPQIVRPLVAAMGAAALEWLFLHILPPGLPTLACSGSIAALFYAVSMALWERRLLSAVVHGVLPVRFGARFFRYRSLATTE